MRRTDLCPHCRLVKNHGPILQQAKTRLKGHPDGARLRNNCKPGGRTGRRSMRQSTRHCRLAVIALTLLDRIFGLVLRITVLDHHWEAPGNLLTGIETHMATLLAMLAFISRSFDVIPRLVHNGMWQLYQPLEWTATPSISRFPRRDILGSPAQMRCLHYPAWQPIFRLESDAYQTLPLPSP